jgi:hypothetical protein
MKGATPKTPASPKMSAKLGRAHGMVKDASGLPLPGARVLIEPASRAASPPA